MPARRISRSNSDCSSVCVDVDHALDDKRNVGRKARGGASGAQRPAGAASGVGLSGRASRVPAHLVRDAGDGAGRHRYGYLRPPGGRPGDIQGAMEVVRRASSAAPREPRDRAGTRARGREVAAGYSDQVRRGLARRGGVAVQRAGDFVRGARAGARVGVGEIAVRHRPPREGTASVAVQHLRCGPLPTGIEIDSARRY